MGDININLILRFLHRRHGKSLFGHNVSIQEICRFLVPIQETCHCFETLLERLARCLLMHLSCHQESLIMASFLLQPLCQAHYGPWHRACICKAHATLKGPFLTGQGVGWPRPLTDPFSASVKVLTALVSRAFEVSLDRSGRGFQRERTIRRNVKRAMPRLWGIIPHLWRVEVLTC